MNKGGNASLADQIRDYCAQNGLSTSQNSSLPEYVKDFVSCQSTSSTKTSDVIDLEYYVFDEAISESSSEEFSELFSTVLPFLELLVKKDNYEKYYLWIDDAAMYCILDGNTLLALDARSNDAAKNLLIELGYPDDKWGTDEEESSGNSDKSSPNSNSPDSSSQNSSENKSETDESGTSNKNNSSESSDPAAEKRDTARRNDIFRIITSLTQYQTNNYNSENGTSPVGDKNAVYWSAPEDGSFGEQCNEACKFIQRYANTSETKNTFIEPGGTLYSVYFTENWVVMGKITPTFGNANTALVADGDGYTIGGNSPFAEHVMYIIPGGQCDENEKRVIKADSSRDIAVMYMLESGEAFCTDD